MLFDDYMMAAFGATIAASCIALTFAVISVLGDEDH